ncbi:MAG: ATP-binding protein [Phycisphaerae bacterium]
MADSVGDSTTGGSTTIGLLELARNQGDRDTYAGKRRWVRYTLGMQIDVTTDPTVDGETWSVITHNVSGGGIGFWSKRELEVGSEVYILDHAAGTTPTWLPARVAHCTVGLRGYLIGASFDNPLLPEEVTDEEPQKTTEEPVDPPAFCKRTPLLRTLAVRCAAATSLTCTVTAATVLVVSHFVSFNLGWVAEGAMLVGGVAILGACLGAVTPRRDARFLQALQAQMRRLAMASDTPGQLIEAPSEELASVRRAFLDLGVRWKKREDDDRAQRQKLEEIAQIKSNILSIVSHDMRTPLTSILLYTQMLSEELNSLAEDDQRSFLKIISDECTRLSRLVDDLLEVQRLESDRARWHLEQQDLSTTIRASACVFEAMAMSKSIKFGVNCPKSLPSVVADADKISQVLSNLLSNAIKFTPAGGRVELSAEPRGTEIVLCVADDGPGIPRDKWDQIFDRFAQLTDPNVSETGTGVGLGLYIVKRIVEAHGGAAWVNSEVGRGSEFYVSLPTRASNVEPETVPISSCPAGRVLVCDSDAELAATMAQTLRTANFDVRVVHSGSRLFAQLDRGDVDVVVTDLSLPDMSASELLCALNRLENRPFRTIIHSYEGDGRELTRKGMDAFLRRPVSRDDLVRAVRLTMQRRSAAGLTVLMLDSPMLDTTRLKELLAGAGHNPVVAGSLKEAVALAHDYAIDVILVSSDSLTTRWAELKGFGVTGEDTTRLMVLCDAIRKNERRLEEAHGVALVAYRPGKEEAVLDAILASQASLEGSPAV